jgi:hypothetical protein
MFHAVLRRRNPQFIDAVVGLHRHGELAPGCYAVDLDAVTRNSRLREEADRPRSTSCGDQECIKTAAPSATRRRNRCPKAMR